MLVHLDDALQAVQLPLKRLAEHRDVFTQLSGSSLTKNRSPAFVELQQVHCGVPLLLLQLVLMSKTEKSEDDGEEAALIGCKINNNYVK